jgi:hypothetical protein
MVDSALDAPCLVDRRNLASVAPIAGSVGGVLPVVAFFAVGQVAFWSLARWTLEARDAIHGDGWPHAVIAPQRHCSILAPLTWLARVLSAAR